MVSRLLPIRVQAVGREALNVNVYDLVDAQGNDLPAFTAGSHIDVHIGDHLVRQYSLCNDPEERHRYRIAVQCEKNGRGGSKELFERFQVGAAAEISEPRNRFSLNEAAIKSVLLAGGIGITPFMSMLYRLQAINADFVLHYITRNVERTAFFGELAFLHSNGRVKFHHDEGDSKRFVDIRSLLPACLPGTHVYYCGPTAFMTAAKDALSDWPTQQVHFESFASTSHNGSNDEHSFRVRLAKTGLVLEVGPNESIVQALRAHGVDVPTSCESGLCGTCRTRYLRGVPDHRDYILSEEERREELLICCARAYTPEITLDL